MSKFELKDVRVTDGFFSDYAELVRTEVIPYQWEALNDRIPGAEKSGCIHNFRIAAGEEEGEFVGMVFQDSDLGKWLEAVAYSLTTHPDKKLEAIADDVIDVMVSYGAVSAGMLDGGSSSLMYYRDYYTKYGIDENTLDEYQKKGLINKYKAFTTPRRLPTCFIVAGE